jgi:hypothetical protein
VPKKKQAQKYGRQSWFRGIFRWDVKHSTSNFVHHIVRALMWYLHKIVQALTNFLQKKKTNLKKDLQIFF